MRQSAGRPPWNSPSARDGRPFILFRFRRLLARYFVPKAAAAGVGSVAGAEGVSEGGGCRLNAAGSNGSAAAGSLGGVAGWVVAPAVRERVVLLVAAVVRTGPVELSCVLRGRGRA